MDCDVLVVGGGLSGLAAACRIADEPEAPKIVLVTSGRGGTPYIAALNGVIRPNSRGDSVEAYIADMLRIGEGVNDRALVERMGRENPRCVELLFGWGVEVALRDGEPLRRHASGSTHPRSLCRTDRLLGIELVEKLYARLRGRGVRVLDGVECLALDARGGEVFGAVTRNIKTGEILRISARAVAAAWGGAGGLFADTTYPVDIDGRALGMAWDAGASLVDLEFLEYEPMVTLWPLDAKGEPCPTAMLGEGAHLLNSAGERFILGPRPEGEAGSPKTLLNRAIWKEIEEGRGGPHGGVFVDLRHLPAATLRAFPWFYERLLNAGHDVNTKLLEVKPAAHSHSGGLLVGADYETTLRGLFAVGEAMGGTHGACRLAGNAAAQALVTGILGAEGILAFLAGAEEPAGERRKPAPGAGGGGVPPLDEAARAAVVPRVRSIAGRILGPVRQAADLKAGIEELKELLASDEAERDLPSRQTVRSALLIAGSCLAREESRGTHYRKDFPFPRDEWRASVVVRPAT